MLFMPGEEGRLIFLVPVIVISVLAFSLVESLFILPAHLSTIKNKKSELLPALNRIQNYFASAMENFIQSKYKPFLEFTLHWRYAAFALFLSVFIVCITM
jgi:multidrug efflux pump subunit AcrB